LIERKKKEEEGRTVMVLFGYRRSKHMGSTSVSGLSPNLETENQRAAFSGNFWKKNLSGRTRTRPIPIYEVTAVMTERPPSIKQ